MGIQQATASFFKQAAITAHADSFYQIANSESAFKDKVAALDNWLASANIESNLHDYVFDLMLVLHFEQQQQFDDYLDSPDWQDVEDYSVERGSELLNILLYLTEAADEQVEINIDDFLYEFLLIEDDEFQDEHRIYEDLIDNADLTECSIDEIVQVFPDSHESELGEMLRPLLLFFSAPNTKLDTSKLTPIEQALYNVFNEMANSQ
jgi:hypothetical protein